MQICLVIEINNFITSQGHHRNQHVGKYNFSMEIKHLNETLF